MKFLTSIDMVKNAIKNLKIESLAVAPSSPVEGLIYFNTADFALYVYRNGAWKDFSSADVKYSELALTTSGNSGATKVGVTAIAGITGGNVQVVLENLKSYVDAVKQALDIKDSVRVATTANITLSGGAPNAVDGVTLSVNDRILVKNQTLPSENGIYYVSTLGTGVNGTWTRSTDADTSAKVTAGLFTFVAEGTINSDKGFVLTTNDAITLGTTALNFTQFSGAGQITAGNGLTKNGDTIDAVGTAGRISVSADAIDIDPAYVGQASITTVGTIATGTWQGTAVAVANGGTGATTASQARANLGATTKYAASIGDGVATSIAVAHNLGSQDVVVMVREVASPYTKVEATIEVTDANSITVKFGTAPTANQYRVVVVG